MIKKLILVFIAVFAFKSYAQDGTASPYSFYGIGSLKFKGTVENRSMGGISVYTDSIHLNLRNPASYGGENLEVYGNESRPVIFSVAGSHSRLNLKSQNGEDELKSSTFDYLSMGIPLGRLGIGFGLIPYSSVGYKLETRNNDFSLKERFRGEGGVNRTYISAGYFINKNFSVGVDVNYNFGNIKNSTIILDYDSSDGTLLEFQSREKNRSDLAGLSLNFGLTYQAMITDKLQLKSGFTYTPETSLNSTNERSFATILFNQITGQEAEVNTIDANLAAQGLDETKFVLPSKYSLGAGVGQPRMWFVGAEYTFQNTKNFKNELYGDAGVDYSNSSTIALGGFFIPEYNSFTSYFKRMVYRGGVRYESSGLNVNNTSIDEFGISFGVGLPVGRAGNDFFSNANIGFEFGKRGTTDSNLIQENFLNFSLSLSLNDRWFQKRRYD
ncbi:hypothetical protein BZARG_1786 [Bizionia argentinensis JUB59]|uniref:Uncharacterized protein n=1 Tax=Bizionia argentinensis JUB59 TaxID=1046627 RepID=G2EDW9_9FLAO|nr:membrane protein [Bizionia argentinensis]EGV43389.1 hypothetical protein BZARG_1786 [Bizionia argentinensis JUB59]